MTNIIIAIYVEVQGDKYYNNIALSRRRVTNIIIAILCRGTGGQIL